MADRIRVAIVDVYPIFRLGVVQALRRDHRFLVVGEGATRWEAERLANKPLDVLLIEAAVPDSLLAAKAIVQAHKNVKVVFLASVENEAHATRALCDGAHGYVMKGIGATELVKVIDSVHGGARYITSELACRLITKPEPAPASNDPRLGLREQQVIDQTSKGLTNREIAQLLGLAVSTVKHYKSLAFRKMGVRNRLEATVFAIGKLGKPKAE